VIALDPTTAGLRVVITGGPYSGKTTIIERLAASGYTTIQEAAIEVIEELTRELGLEGQARWRTEHRDEFQLRIVRMQMALEAAAPLGATVFQDRGRLDGLAYCRVFGSEVPPELVAACAELPYDRVFVLDTLTSFVTRTDTGRTSDRDRSLRIRDALMDAYSERGLRPVFVPELPIEERVRFVLDHL
jgi:predicted ATPase